MFLINVQFEIVQWEIKSNMYPPFFLLELALVVWKMNHVYNKARQQFIICV